VVQRSSRDPRPGARAPPSRQRGSALHRAPQAGEGRAPPGRDPDRRGAPHGGAARRRPARERRGARLRPLPVVQWPLRLSRQRAPRAGPHPAQPSRAPPPRRGPSPPRGVGAHQGALPVGGGYVQGLAGGPRGGGPDRAPDPRPGRGRKDAGRDQPGDAAVGLRNGVAPRRPLRSGSPGRGGSHGVRGVRPGWSDHRLHGQGRGESRPDALRCGPPVLRARARHRRPQSEGQEGAHRGRRRPQGRPHSAGDPAPQGAGPAPGGGDPQPAEVRSSPGSTASGTCARSSSSARCPRRRRS
jgi:hypothetical protein